MTQETPRKLFAAPYEIFLIENPEFEWFTNYQIEPRIKDESCPECGAASRENCYNKRTFAIAQSSYIHRSRVLKFCEGVGITRAQLEVMPYRRWPEADSYPYWGCFPYRSGGDYAKKHKEKFPRYEDAKASSKARDQYNESVAYKNKLPPYTVQPMAYCRAKKKLVRWDLVKKEG